MLNWYNVNIKLPEGELEDIFLELIEAQEKIRRCYDRLYELGVLVIEKKETTSGN